MKQKRSMTLDEIKALTTNIESRSVEYKQSMAELEKLGKAICGFLNSDGGLGLIGITDKRKIVGIEVTESTKNKLSIFCNHFDPWPDLNINYVPLENTNKQVVVIEAVPRSDNMPFVYKGTPYLRNEAQLKQMSVENHRQRLLQSSGLSERWENLPAKNKYSFDDLDSEEILRTMNIGLNEKRIPDNIYTRDPHEALISLDLISGSGRLTNAAMILFAKKESSDYIQCFLRMGRFVDETMNHTLDSKQVNGNIFQLLEEAEIFVRKHLPIASRYDPNKLERIDEAALPFLAVREAIINSLIHRDYSDYAGDIALLIFNTHLEIHNIGNLYGGMTVSKLKKRHPSRRRNPKIAQVFYIRKLIERYGSGTLRMIDLCKQQGLQPPEFSEAGDGFLVKFYFKKPIGPALKLPVPQKLPDLTSRQLSILQILTRFDNKPIALRQIVEQLEDPPASRTVGDDLAHLKSLHLVDSFGVGKGAKWFLIKKNGAK